MAEESLLRIETQEAVRKEANSLRGQDFSARTIEQSPSQAASNTDRSDRDSYSRGR